MADKAPAIIPNDSNTFNLPLDRIVANPKQNYRTTMDPQEFKETKESMKKQGQIQAVEVCVRPDGKYDLVLGFRRYKAAGELLAEGAKKPNGETWDTIRCSLAMDKEGKPLDAKSRKLRNMAENMARENLTTFDQAMAFNDLKHEEDLTANAIAQNTGKSVSYVNNLIRLATSLEPVIIKRWKEESTPDFGTDSEGKKLPNIHAVCTVNWLQELAANVPAAEQELALHKALGLVDDDDEDDDDGTSREPKTPTGGAKRPGMAHLKKALEIAQKELVEHKREQKEAEKPVDEAWVLELGCYIVALEFAMGARKSIKGIYTMPKEQ